MNEVNHPALKFSDLTFEVSFPTVLELNEVLFRHIYVKQPLVNSVGIPDKNQAGLF